MSCGSLSETRTTRTGSIVLTDWGANVTVMRATSVGCVQQPQVTQVGGQSGSRWDEDSVGLHGSATSTVIRPEALKDRTVTRRASARRTGGLYLKGPGIGPQGPGLGQAAGTRPAGTRPAGTRDR